MGYAELIAGAVAAIGALISAGKEAEAQKIREQMAAEYGPDILPDLDAAIAEQAGPAALEGMQEDGTGRQAQVDTLAELDNVYQTGGRTDADEAAYKVAGRHVAQRAGQRAGDIGIEAARRGQTGSGLSAVLQAQGGQDELEALASLDAEVASSGRGRALQALGMKGQLASGVRGDDWRAMSGRADATDLMNRFNASQRQQTTLRNAGLSQQQFDNNMNRLAGQGAARSGVAAGLERQGQNVRETAAGLGNAALSFGSAWDDDGGDRRHDDEDEDH